MKVKDILEVLKGESVKIVSWTDGTPLTDVIEQEKVDKRLHSKEIAYLKVSLFGNLIYYAIFVK